MKKKNIGSAGMRLPISCAMLKGPVLKDFVINGVLSIQFSTAKTMESVSFDERYILGCAGMRLPISFIAVKPLPLLCEIYSRSKYLGESRPPRELRPISEFR